MTDLRTEVDGEAHRRHYCRGCGRLLPAGTRSHFHKECLRSDKRERLREQRRREEERFKVLLLKKHCSKCGARYVESISGRATEAFCEASQTTQKSEAPRGPGLGHGNIR